MKVMDFCHSSSIVILGLTPLLCSLMQFEKCYICSPTGYMTPRWHPKCLSCSPPKDEQLFDTYDMENSENEVLETQSEFLKKSDLGKIQISFLKNSQGKSQRMKVHSPQ